MVRAQVFELLERHRVALCLHDKDGSAIDRPFVGPFVYVRFHGTNGRYHGSYSDAALSAWAQTLAARWRSGQPVYAYFNNDPNADATRNAATLKQMLSAMTEGRELPRSKSPVQTARANLRGGVSVSDDDIRT